MEKGLGQKTVVVLAALANGVALAAFAFFSVEVNSNVWIAVTCLILGIAGGVVAPIFTGFGGVHREEISAKLNERKRAIKMFTEVTHGLFKLDKDHKLRVTLLEIDKSTQPPRFIQRARCECDGPKPPSKTTMSTHQGVAGRAYREQKLFTVNFNEGDFIQQMLAWGFEKAEAEKFEADRAAFLCSPIFDAEDQVIGVLSLDAKTPNVFLPEHNEIAEWVTPFFARFLSEPAQRGDQ
jgi:hypothetical protein